jgi:hypothetical protein
VPASAYTVEACELGEMPWTHRAPEVERRIARLSEGCQRLGDHFKVGQGIKTGLNSVYVMDRERAAALSLPESIIRPTIEARQIQAGRLVGKEKVMLRVLGSTAISEHESLETYLEEHKGRLQRRYQVRKGACPWYALALPQNLHLMVAPQKIVTPLYSRTNRFAVDRGGCHVGTGVYVMVAVAEVPVSLEVVCAVLNSRPLAEFVRARAKLKRDGYLEFAGRLLRSLPLPPWGQEGWAELEGLVAADDGCEGGSARVRAEIDGVVAGLFGLEGGWG